jgi:hypothetical protein
MSAATSQLGVDHHDRWLTAGRDGARPHRAMAHADPCRTDDTDAWLEEGLGLLAPLMRPEVHMERCLPYPRDMSQAIKRHSA